MTPLHISVIVPALALALAAPLAAQQAAQQADTPAANAAAATHYMTADALDDANIVTLESQYDESIWSAGTPFDTIEADWDEIGEVEDVILNATGQVVGLTTDVGGFLGIGEKTVLLPLEDLRVVRTGDDPDDLTVVTRLNSEALEALPEFDLDLDD